MIACNIGEANGIAYLARVKRLIDSVIEIEYNSIVTISNIKENRMDNIILGLLLLSSRTIYQLRERIDKGLNMMYSSSMGSIQAAIKKLLNYGYIQYEETVENGKYKKIYSITDSGKQKFIEWVSSPMEMQSIKNPELAKLYFMGFSTKEKREEGLQEYISKLKQQYDVLHAICKEADNVNVPDENKEILHYQFTAARYGRDFMKFNIEWYQKLLDEMRNKRL